MMEENLWLENQSFEDHEWMVAELNCFFFKLFITGQLPLT
jgi:hypothetical protein